MNDKQWVVVIVVMIFYFVPFLIANYIHHRNQVSIFVLNAFLGWTYIGWVAALIWAFKKEEK